jgi:hypothetical protein
VGGQRFLGPSWKMRFFPSFCCFVLFSIFKFCLAVLGMEPKTSRMPGKHEPQPSPDSALRGNPSVSPMVTLGLTPAGTGSQSGVLPGREPGVSSSRPGVTVVINLDMSFTPKFHILIQPTKLTGGQAQGSQDRPQAQELRSLISN